MRATSNGDMAACRFLESGIRMQEANINLEVFNLETDFFGDLHCSSRFIDMLCDAQAQYGDCSELEKCPMWGMWKKEVLDELGIK